MNELAQTLKMLRRGLPTVILKHPTGNYGLAGGIPIELTTESKTALIPGLRVSMVWKTEQEVIDALVALGKTHFQTSDCAWYDNQPQP